MANDVVPIPVELMSDDDAPDWAFELDEAILAGIEIEPERKARWRITNDGMAEWAMRKLALLVEREREARFRAAGWRERIDEWERAEVKRVTPGQAHFTALLEEYGIVQRREADRATVSVPSGSITTRQSKQPVVEVADEALFLSWCDDELPDLLQDDVVRTKREPRIMELRKRTTAKPVELPYCSLCGFEIRPVDEGVGDWVHGPAEVFEGVTEQLRQLDDDHTAKPRTGYVVVWKTDDTVPDELDGKVVAGLRAALPGPNPTVTVAR